jgi:hypothetical protein
VEPLGREKFALGCLQDEWMIKASDDGRWKPSCRAKITEHSYHVSSGIIVQDDTELLRVRANTEMTRFQRADTSLGFVAIQKFVSHDRLMEFDSFQDGRCKGVEAYIWRPLRFNAIE